MDRERNEERRGLAGREKVEGSTVWRFFASMSREQLSDGKKITECCMSRL